METPHAHFQNNRSVFPPPILPFTSLSSSLFHSQVFGITRSHEQHREAKQQSLLLLTKSQP